MPDLTHSRSPKHVVLKGATHFAQYEAGRAEPFEAVDAILRDTSRGSQTKGGESRVRAADGGVASRAAFRSGRLGGVSSGRNAPPPRAGSPRRVSR